MHSNSPITEYITFLYAQDLDVSAQFYEQIFQFGLVLDQGSCRIYRIRAGAYLGICREKSPHTTPTNSVIFTFVTDNVDGWYNRLLAFEVPIIKPPALNPDFKIYHFFVHDPDGYVIEIQRFMDPRWSE